MKPLECNTVDTKLSLITEHQQVMFDGIKGRCQVKYAQSGHVSTVCCEQRGLSLYTFITAISVTVTVTVTETLVLRPLLEDRGCITESIRILVPVNRIKQKYLYCETDSTLIVSLASSHYCPGKPAAGSELLFLITWRAMVSLTPVCSFF